MGERRASLFSIPPGMPFLDTLVGNLLAGKLISGFPDPHDPLSLARATLLLPTRRACRAVLDSFVAHGGQAILLPRIRAIGDEDDETNAAIDEAGLIDLPEAVPALLRRTTLMRLILAWDRERGLSASSPFPPMQPRDAAFLAGELARLMDLIATQAVPWDRLDALLPADLQEHWQITHDFLQLARRDWPDFLARHHFVDPAERRRLAMEAELARLSGAPDRPVIAAGSTGSIPTTAQLLATIARLPLGAVVLPGLDRQLSQTIWEEIKGSENGSPAVASHPQATLIQLITMMRMSPEDVVHLADGEPPELARREALISRVMWPAKATADWNLHRPSAIVVQHALEGVSLVEAANEEEEGLAIALLMRETLEGDHQNAALVTPDRALARRVAAELQRFGLVVDDTAGTPLSDTALGLFARLSVDVVHTGFAAIPLLALLKHPATRLGLSERDIGAGVSALERAALRGLSPKPGIAGLRQALSTSRRSQARLDLDDEALARAGTVLNQVEAALGPLVEQFAQPQPQPFVRLVEAHRNALLVLLAGKESESADESALWQFLDELADTHDSALILDPHAYSAAIDSLMRDQPVRRAVVGEPRLKIYGLLEARLVRPDRLILASLNEGLWPAAARTDPWLSRGMRAGIALPAPEQRIGLAAHDFTQGLGASEVVLTRAKKIGTAPSVPSRWLQRLAAVIGEEQMATMRQRGARVLRLARLIDEPKTMGIACVRPEPRPPVALRPRDLSVTEIETLIRDPYSIYAKHVLKLRPYEEIGQAIEARERGTLFHACLEAVAHAIANDPLADRASLLKSAEIEFETLSALPQVRSFWWPRFVRVFDWFLNFDGGRRAKALTILVEASGRLSFDAPAGLFTLRGKADRIEVYENGLSIIDFKTGAIPKVKEVQRGFAPQLTLEAAMIRRHGFEQLNGLGRQADELMYIKLTGGEPPAMIERRKAEKDQTLSALSDETWDGLRRMIARFDQAETPYASLAAGENKPRFNDYAHLARVKEWGIAGEEGEE